MTDYDDDRSFRSVSPSVPTIDLYKDAFFLHSFLDENIGSGKGNNPVIVVDEFLRHSPEPFKTNFTTATQYVKPLNAISVKATTPKLNVESQRAKQSSSRSHGYGGYGGYSSSNDRYDSEEERVRDCTYSYDISDVHTSFAKVDSLHLNKVGSTEYLKSLWGDYYPIAKLFPDGFAKEYKRLDYFIDPRAEGQLNDELNNIVDKVVEMSASSPVFVPIGYSGHLIGLLLTPKHIVITNSGQGLDNHNTYSKIAKGSKPTSEINQVAGTSGSLSILGSNEESQKIDSLSMLQEMEASASQKKKKVIKKLPSDEVSGFSFEQSEIEATKEPTKKKVTVNVSSSPVSSFNISSKSSKKTTAVFEEDDNVSGFDFPSKSLNTKEDVSDRDDVHNNQEQNKEVTQESEEAEGLPAYPQCVLYFARPCNDVLKKIVKEFVQIKKNYTNVDIHSVYAIVYKLYFLHIINTEGYRDQVEELMNDVSSEIITKHNMTNGISITDISTYERAHSSVLRPAWIHPEYHENIVYKVDVDFRESIREIKELCTDELLSKVFKEKQSVHFGDIAGKILNELITYHPIYLAVSNLTRNGFNPLREFILDDVAGLIRTKKAVRSPDVDAAYFNKIHHNVEYKIVEGIVSGMYPDEYKTDFEKIVPSGIYEISQEERKKISNNVKNHPTTKKMIQEEMEEQISLAANHVFTEEHIKAIQDMLALYMNPSVVRDIEDAVRTSKPFSLRKLINDKFQTLRHQLTEYAGVNGFSKFDYYTDTSMSGATVLRQELFCDILLHESSVSNDSIIVKKNHSGFIQGCDSILKSPNTTPAHMLITALEQKIPELFAKVSRRKIDAAFPHNFYVREQFAGSCTFNGTILAVSLLGPNNVAVTPESPLILYQKDYNLLKSYIQDNLIAMTMRELESGKSLAEKDRLVIEALDVLYERENRDKSFITLLRQKLPKQTVSSIDAKLIKGMISEKPTDEAAKFYTKIQPLTDNKSIVTLWNDVIKIIEAKHHIEHRFIKSVMEPFIEWILNFEATKPSLSKVADTMDPILEILKSVVAIENMIMKKVETRDTLAIYMAVLYAIFKTIQMKGLFDEKAVQNNIKLYKASRAEQEQMFGCFYLTSTMSQRVLMDLSQILDTYQFLFLTESNMLDFVRHATLIPLKSSSDKTDVSREYQILQEIPEIVMFNTVLNDSIFGRTKTITLSNLTATSMISEWLIQLCDKQQKEFVEKKQDNLLYLDRNRLSGHVNFEHKGTSTHVCLKIIATDESSVDDVVFTIKNRNKKDIVVYPKNGYAVFKFIELSQGYGENRTSIEMAFNVPVKAVQVFQFSIPESMTESQVYLAVPKPMSLSVTCIDKRAALPSANIMDMMKMKNMLLNGKYYEFDSYMNQFFVQHHDSIRTNWSYPYKYNFYLPLLHNMSPEKVGTLSIIKNNDLTYVDSTKYQFYNTHDVAQYYTDHVTEIYESVRAVNLPLKETSAIQRLRVLVGQIDDYVEPVIEEESYGSSRNTSENQLTLRWGPHKQSLKLTSKANDPDAKLSDSEYVFTIKGENVSGASRKIVYNNENDKVTIDGYRIIDETEANRLIKDLETKKKIKNAQMLKNMMYYAQGIPEFIVGINDSLSQGIICFFPKTPDYYKMYFYNNAWTEMDESNVTDGEKFYNLLNMSNSVERKLLWVVFDIDMFNAVLPITGSEIISETDNYMLTFTLFCEHLMIQGKHDLFNLLIPQLVSCYSIVSDSSSKYSMKTVNDKHKIFINFMLKEEYIVSPYRYYFLNKLKLLVNGSYDLMTLYEYSKRQEYYAPRYQKFDDVVDLMQGMESNRFDMQYYVAWTKEYDKIIKGREKEKKPSLIRSVKQILSTMQGIKEHTLSVEQISNYSNMLAYICDKNVFESMTLSLQLNILKTVEDILENLVEDETEIQGNIKYFINPTFDHEESSEFTNYVKLFELITGKILDKIQYDFVKNMLNDDTEHVYKVYELLMGRGKTFVIIPCTIFCNMLSGSYYNIINCLPSHLMNQSMKVLNKLSPFLINGSIVRAKADRKSELNKSITQLINKTSRKVICIDDQSLKAYLLSIAEDKAPKKDITDTESDNSALEGGSKQKNSVMAGGLYISIDDVERVLYDIIQKQNNKANRRMLARLGNVNEETYSAFRDNTLILMDEFDSLIDPLKSDLNYPYGSQKNLDQQIILNKLVVSVTEMIFNKYKNYMMYSDRADAKINKLMIRSIMNSLDKDKYQNIFEIYNKISKKVEDANEGTIEQFRSLDRSEIEKISAYQKGGKNRHHKLKQQHGGSEMSLMMFFIREVYTTYIMCMEMMLDKDYGWDKANSDNPFVVIPYSAQKTPMEGSKFSSPIINIVLTTIAYFSKPFRQRDSSELTEYIRFLITTSSKDYVLNEKNLDSKGVSIAMMKDDSAFATYMHHLKDSEPIMYHNYVRMYLEELILIKYVTVDPDIYNCSFIDIIDPDFIRSKFALSGTVNVHLPEFKYYGDKNKLTGIVDDKMTKEKIQRVVTGVEATLMLEDLTVPKDIRNTDDLLEPVANIINKLDEGNYNVVYSIIALLGNDSDESKNYNVLIDVGSFLRNYENNEFALLASHYYPDRHIVFFDPNDQPIAMLNTQIVQYDMKSLKHDLRTKVIFDQKHTIGTDLDLHSSSRGILTVSNMTTRSPLVQGAFRFREADLNQKLTYLAKDIRQTTTELVQGIDKREEQSFIRSKVKFYQQTILCLMRRYDRYSNESYRFKGFIPSIDMSDEIFVKGKYSHDYKKEAFAQYVKKFLADTDLYIESLNTIEKTDPMHKIAVQYNTDTLREQIKQEISMYLQKLDESDVVDTSVMVQKQTNVQREKNYQSATESNKHRKDFKHVEVKFPKISVYDIDLKPTTINNAALFDQLIEEDPLMKQLKEYGIITSPNAAYCIAKTFQNGETNDLFFLMFIGDGDDMKVMLYTSLDLIILSLYQKDLMKELIPVTEFKINDASKKSFYQNFIMFLLLKIPTTKAMDYFETQQPIKDLSPKIGAHYKDVFRYNISSISKRFADYIGLV